jgi:hypothetical protein
VTPPAAVQRPPAGPTSPQLRSRRTPLLLSVLALAGVLLVSQLLASPHFLSHITFDNPTPYNLSVEVSNGSDGWLPLGSVEPRRATSVGEIYDIGDVWNVRVSTQGETVGRFRVTRDQLEHANWHVEIPRRIGNDLEAAAVPPQP